MRAQVARSQQRQWRRSPAILRTQMFLRFRQPLQTTAPRVLCVCSACKRRIGCMKIVKRFDAYRWRRFALATRLAFGARLDGELIVGCVRRRRAIGGDWRLFRLVLSENDGRQRGIRRHGACRSEEVSVRIETMAKSGVSFRL